MIIPGKAMDDYPFRSWSALMQYNDLHYGEKPWMVYLDGKGARSVWSYSVFTDVARRLATLLKEEGVDRGHRVVIAGHNHPDTVLAYFACWLLGACAVPINLSEDDSRLSYIIKQCGANVALVRSEYLDRVRERSQGVELAIVEVDTDQADPDFYRKVRDLQPLEWTQDDDMLLCQCLLVYTSGTTGAPKGVVLVQQNLFADGMAIAKWHGIDENTRMMCVLPIHHVNGTIVTHVTPFIAGGSVVLHYKFSPSRFFTSIVDEQVHVVSVVPTLLAMLLEAEADASGAKQAGLRHIICGAGPLTCDLARRFETAYSTGIVHGYGLSETTCYSCFLPIDLSNSEHTHWMFDHGFPSIGVPLPCNEMAIHDTSGVEVPDGQRGEIVIRGANVMLEYDSNPVANEQSVSTGWFRSGDEGYVVADEHNRKFFFITGRLKELIIRGGVNLAPLEIDEVINSAPGVKAGISVGFENEFYGEEVGALVVSRDGNNNAEAIIDYCSANLPFSKCPKVVVFTDALPVTSTGKYQRNKVKHLFSQWRDIQFRK